MQDDMAFEYEKWRQALKLIEKSINDYFLDDDFDANACLRRVQKIVKDALS